MNDVERKLMEAAPERYPGGGYNREDIDHIKISMETTIRMNEGIVNRINNKVKRGDTLWILGDLGWDFLEHYKWFVRTLRDDIQCRNIRFLWGNHDCKTRGDYGLLPIVKSILEDARVEDWGPLRTVKINHQKLVLCHYPMGAWDKSHYDSIQLFGHNHSNYNSKALPNQVDVGVDNWDYNPVSLDEIMEHINERRKTNMHSE